MKWSADTSKYPAYLHKLIKKGRGVGSFDTYQPWVQKSDFGSSGSATTAQGIIVPRIHHVLSDLEHIYLMLLERQPDVVDIREQWPILHVDQTLAICEEIGESHRYEGGALVPFTIDFMVTKEARGKRRYEAKSIKTPKDAKNPKIRKRLLVEHLWCKSKNCEWVLVKTDGFSGRFKKIVFENLNFMREWFKNRYDPDEEELSEFVKFFIRIYDPDRRLDEILESVAASLRISEGLTDNIFRFAIWSDQIPVLLTEKIDLVRPLILKR